MRAKHGCTVFYSTGHGDDQAHQPNSTKWLSGDEVISCDFINDKDKRTSAYTMCNSCICSHSELWPKNAFGIAFVAEAAAVTALSDMLASDSLPTQFSFFIQKKNKPKKTQFAKKDTWPPMPLVTLHAFEWMRAIFIFILRFSSEINISVEFFAPPRARFAYAGSGHQ